MGDVDSRSELFRTRRGDSFSRSNAIRPLDAACLKFFVLEFLGSAGLIGIGIIEAGYLYFDDDPELDGYAWVIIGLIGIFIALACMTIFACDIVRRWTLQRRSISELKVRLSKESKSYCYTASTRQVWNAALFAVATLFCVAVRAIGFFYI